MKTLFCEAYWYFSLELAWGGLNMNQEEGKREIVFQMTMNAARLMLEKGLITKEEYLQFDTKMKQKYKPIIGNLFSNIDLQ